MAAQGLRAAALITLLVTGNAALALAQETPLELARLSGPITLDGKPDEPAWEQVRPFPLTMYTPVFRGQPTQRTEIRVAYDSENLYVAGRFYSRIQGLESRLSLLTGVIRIATGSRS